MVKARIPAAPSRLDVGCDPAAQVDWYATILDSVADGVFTVDERFCITSFNSAAERITGYSRTEAIGRPCNEIFRADICASRCALRRSFQTGEPLVNIRVGALNREGRQVPISVSTAILRGGGHQGGVETFRDLSTEEQLRKEARASAEPTGVIGRHPRLQRIYDILPDVAASEATVLIEGPSGSGKGLLAAAIHASSPRRDAPVRQSQLRRAAGEPARIGALRLPQGCVHRRPA